MSSDAEGGEASSRRREAKKAKKAKKSKKEKKAKKSSRRGPQGHRLSAQELAARYGPAAEANKDHQDVPYKNATAPATRVKDSDLNVLAQASPHLQRQRLDSDSEDDNGKRVNVDGIKASPASSTSSAASRGRKRQRYDSDSEESTQDTPKLSTTMDRDVSPPRRRSRARSGSDASSASSSSSSAASAASVSPRPGGPVRDLSPVRRRPRLDSASSDSSSSASSPASSPASRSSAPPPQTVFRDEFGRKIDIEAQIEEQQKAAEQDARARAKLAEEWRSGAADKALEAAEAYRLAQARERPFAIHADDAALNAWQSAAPREGDPMADLLARSQGKRSSKSTQAEDDARVASLRKTYQGPRGPPNRFGISPGYRWDGVDRTNGFEAKVLRKQR